MPKKEFKAESKRLLDLMINSIYTNRDIFLRELISNASDAIDKLCYISLTDSNVGLTRSDFAINLSIDKEARTITLSDNGVGMDAQSLEDNLGIIANSGSLKFKNEMNEKNENTENIDIIGQFGVGFYSAFMVSENVTVTSLAYGADTANQWVSNGADGYTIAPCDKKTVGTDIVMTIKLDTENDDYSHYLDANTIKNLIKKYSDYIRYPIKMDVEKTRPLPKTEEDKPLDFETYMENETLNDMVPIWHKQKSDVTDEDYNNFYKEKFMDYGDPAKSIKISTEGVVSYEALLFIPSTTPFNYFTKEYEKGLQLYSSGVLIMDKCSDLLPEHFRFVRGIVDSQDLSLNISREMLQQDRQLQVIATSIDKKIKRELMKMLDKDREKYENFFKNFGVQLKYGVVADYGMNKDALKDLILFYSSTEEKPVTLLEYVSRMKEDQTTIYYACGETITKVNRLPQTENIKEKGYEILYLIDEVDDFVMQILHDIDGKEIKSVNSDNATSEEEREIAETKTAEHKDLLSFVKESLLDKVKDVKISDKLKSHPVCLSSEGDISLEMEKYFAQMQSEDNMKADRILELNCSHPMFTSLNDAFLNDKDRAKKLSELLYQQAMLIAGFPIDDPTAYADLVCELITN